jgi:hypothetical protein
MKNYHSLKERKFTILQLEIRKFEISDIIILSIFFASILIQHFVSQIKPSDGFFGLWIISFIIYVGTINTPMGLRFRNIYFSTIWIVLCILFLANGTSLSIIPLATLLLYHGLRLIFWNRYKKEFIPYEVGIGRLKLKNVFKMNLTRFISKIEGRGGYKEDRNFMKWLVRIGFILFMICFLMSIPHFQHESKKNYNPHQFGREY